MELCKNCHSKTTIRSFLIYIVLFLIVTPTICWAGGPYAGYYDSYYETEPKMVVLRYEIIVAIFFFMFIPVTAWIVICEVTNIDIRNLTNNIKQIAIDVDRIDNELRVKMPSENEQALEWIRQRPTRLTQIYQTTRKMEDQLLTITDNARYLYDRLNKLHAIRREKIPDVSRYNDILKTAKSLVPVELDNFLEKAALLLDKNKKNVWNKLFNGNKVRENVDLKEIGAAAKEMGQLVKMSLKISDETKNAITELYIQDISQIKRGLERIEHIGRKIVSVAEGLAVIQQFPMIPKMP